QQWNSDLILNEFDPLDYPLTQLWTKSLENVTILRSGLVAKRGSIVRGSLHEYPHRIAEARLRALYNTLFRRARAVPDRGVYTVAHTDWSSGYYHWITEAVPRMIHARQVDSECLLILPGFAGIQDVVDETVAA